MRIPSIKTVVTVLAIIEVWLILQVPSVGDLLFNFVVGGEVPGTDKVLSPTQMILFLIGLFILAAGLIFKKEIIGATEKTRIAPIQPEQQPAPPVAQKQAVPKRSATLRRKSFTVLPVVQKLLPYARHARDYIARGANRAWAAASPKLVTAWNVFRRYSRLGIRKAHQAFVWACATGLYLMYRSGIFIRAKATELWRWLRPRIEQADRWIERKLRQNPTTATLLGLGAELLVTIRGWIVRVRSMLQ